MNREHQGLFDKYCKHKDMYDVVSGIDEWSWEKCSDCKLRGMTFMVKHSLGLIPRDICFAIWHGRGSQLKWQNL